MKGKVRCVFLALSLSLLFVSAVAWGAESPQVAGAAQDPQRRDDFRASGTAPLRLADVLTDRFDLIEGVAPLGFASSRGDLPRDSMSEGRRRQIQAQLDRNMRALEARGKLPPLSPLRVTLDWPLRLAHEWNDHGYHTMGFFVDHNPAYPEALRDYSCGTRTYDLGSGYNHAGTDFSLWPFGWTRMDNDAIEVVAAAAGTIVNKADGNYDRNCAMGDAPWNAVYVRHADGSVAWYGHLKNGSLTGKGIGDTVAAGEYLGIVGSSGSSTGPHLHLEIYDAGNQVVDPYQGPCNSAPSWWAAQRPYDDSAVNKVTTGDAEPERATCPMPWDGHMGDSFNPGDTIHFTTYYRDLLSTQVSQYTIYRPDGSIFSRWTDSSDDPLMKAAYFSYYFSFGADKLAGTWRFEVSYEGQTYGTFFNFNDPTFIQMSSPTGGESWERGSTKTIRWSDNLGGNVRIELYKGGVQHSTIAKSTASDGNRAWTLPLSLDPGSDYRVRITNETNPTLYAQSGAFSIRLPSAPVADFRATPTRGASPLNVSFTDTSAGAVDSWSWTFGDGSTSSQQNPLHLYTAIGEYTVSLAVSGPGGSDTETKTQYVSVQDMVKVYLPLVLRSYPPAPPGVWVTVLQETFEGEFPGAWLVGDNIPGAGEYYWGKRSCRAYAGSYSGWAVGGGSNGSGLPCGSNYPHNAEGWMIYGPFRLADATAAELTYQLWLHSSSHESDVIATLASIDGVNFYGTSTWGNSQGWVERRFDLSNVTTLGDLTGRPQVWVALIFASDGSENYPEGAYVDNIVLRKYVQGSSRARMERIPSGPVPGSESLKQVPAHKVLGWEPGNSGDRE